MSSSLRREVGTRLSPAAWAELFAHGAGEAYAAYWAEHGDASFHCRPLDEAGRQAIARMRRLLSDDPTPAGEDSQPYRFSGDAWYAVQVGRAHALAALALGFGVEDPGFEAAAQAWGAARAAVRSEEDLLQQLMEDHA